MSTSDIEEQVYVGVWTNWSRGPVMGSTLTLPRDEGNLLIAFTASFIAFVAARFWRMACVCWHRLYSTSDLRPALYHQRQILLRNSASAESAFMALLYLLVAWWYGLGLRRLGSLLPLILFAAISFVAFTAAGGFSSTIASGVGNTVMLKGDNCGFGTAPDGATMEETTAYYTAVADTSSNADNYAEHCYRTDPAGTLDCSRLVKKGLDWEKDANAPCPFTDSSVCRSPQNIRLDSGLIETSRDLGLNSPTGERAAIRYVLECAPLVTQGHKEVWPRPNATIVAYNYGPRLVFGDGGAPMEINYTHSQRDVEAQYQYLTDDGLSVTEGLDLQLSIAFSITLDGEPYPYLGGFTPLEGMRRADGDVHIVWLSGNGVAFNEGWDDDWYRATVPGPIRYTTDSGTATKLEYVPEEAASPLGCVEQYQICNTANSNAPSCGPLASSTDAWANSASLFNFSKAEWHNGTIPINNTQASFFLWIQRVLTWNPTNLQYLLAVLASKSLASHRGLNLGAQFDIPSDGPHWQADVEKWFKTLLAAIQISFMNAPLGPATPNVTVIRPLDKTQQRLCDSQKVQSSAYTSFSMFGLCFTYALGGLIVFGSWGLEPLLEYLSGRYGYKRRQQLEWMTNNAFQLHRLAHEELGYGSGWRGCDGEVPVTVEGETLLGALNLDDPKHPVIAKPGSFDYEEKGHANAEDITIFREDVMERHQGSAQYQHVEANSRESGHIHPHNGGNDSFENLSLEADNDLSVHGGGSHRAVSPLHDDPN